MTATMSFKCSTRVENAFTTLAQPQQEAITAMAARQTINFIADNPNGSIKVYTSRPASGVAMTQDKKIWWINATGKATVIAYKW